MAGLRSRLSDRTVAVAAAEAAETTGEGAGRTKARAEDITASAIKGATRKKKKKKKGVRRGGGKGGR